MKKQELAAVQQKTPLNPDKWGLLSYNNKNIMARGKSNAGRKAGKGRRKYDVITTEMRIRLIQLVLGNNLTVAAACRTIGIKLTTGCLIIRNYRKQKRIFQKPGSIGPEIIPSFPSAHPKIEKKRSRAERLEARNAIREGEDEETEKVEELVGEIKVQTEEGSEIPISQPMPAALDSSLFPSIPVEATYQLMAYPFQMFFWTNQPY